MRTLLGLTLLILLTQVACGDDLEGETLIGASCKHASDCDVGGVCITTGTDGLCSQECRNPGQAQECPLGTYCDEQNVETTDATQQSMTLCFPACENDDDCRDGYKCNNVNVGHGKICVPENVD